MALLIAHITVAQAATIINVLIAFLQYTLGLALVALLLHASLWSTLLRTGTMRGAGARVALFSYLSLTTTVLVAVAGVVMSLGLSVGPMLQTPPKSAPAAFVADASPRQGYTYGRVVVDRFNVTPFGPFGIQFRRSYNGTAEFNYPIWHIRRGRADRQSGQPGCRLWNYTMPAGMMRGGVWSEDVLWLEPVSECRPTTSPTHDYPTLSCDGQHVDLREHAYKGAALSNFYTLLSFNNMTRNESYLGRALPINSTQSHFYPLDMLYTSDVNTGSNTSINGATLQTGCNGLFLGPPQRPDGGDARLPEDNSMWSQRMFGCASATHARMQRVEFSFNGTIDLWALGIKRARCGYAGVVGTKKTDMELTTVDLLWGRVPNALESDPSLWTVRSDVFYVPAGAVDLWGLSTGGQPSTLPAIS
ncbi:hypothetical protein B0H17DRAFT_1332646 [Mycena rosella]|uniref:Uncharacterized protein n=1 Tax=Mycena rosella TaxID=1033263 RepID=A0AAD7GBL9_MYCRO|nr:hypothetical protein B0H17DRAFT_1332646 [Mycena rosella]